MRRRPWGAIAMLAAALAPIGCHESVSVRLREAGRLGTIRLITPAGERAGLVFLFGGDQRAAELLAASGLDVVEVDLGAYLSRLRGSDDGCYLETTPRRPPETSDATFASTSGSATPPGDAR